jgi:ABC-type multidrug transport system ATPase subunit
VLTETRRVKHPENKDIIKVVNFKKVYATKSGGCCVDCDSSFVAVSNLNFGVSAGEVFALLGVNGAGKSTTFKSLTYEVTPTEGTI